MGYVENNLMPREKILYTTKLHWIVYGLTLFWIFLAIFFIIGGKEIASIAAFFFLIAAIMGVSAIINQASSEFGLTNKRVIMKTGFIRRNSIEVLLSKTEVIQVNQGILGRMLGYGSLIISGTGGMKDPFHKIKSPLEFRTNVLSQIDKIEKS
jgi:uncharacterized membrane protein YdbT with pleckstrin-like domain